MLAYSVMTRNLLTFYMLASSYRILTKVKNFGATTSTNWLFCSIWCCRLVSAVCSLDTFWQDGPGPDEVPTAEERGFWKAVEENPNDFASWTYLLQVVEKNVSVLLLSLCLGNFIHEIVIPKFTDKTIVLLTDDFKWKSVDRLFCCEIFNRKYNSPQICYIFSYSGKTEADTESILFILGSVSLLLRLLEEVCWPDEENSLQRSCFSGIITHVAA